MSSAMAQVEVRQLRYRGEPAKATRVESAVVDALRTEVVDDGRLVLVRRFRLGRIALAERGAAPAAASAWRTVRDGARHGGASGAESADCVWFTDAAEARTLLIRELARGRVPFGWFWALAVPDWRRQTLAQWLDRRLDEAARDSSGAVAALLIAEATEAGAVERLAAAILARTAAPSVGPQLARDRDEGLRESGAAPERPLAGEEDAAEEAFARAVVLTVNRSVPAPLRLALSTAAVGPHGAVLIEALARGLVRRAHPELTLAPARLLAIAAAVVRTPQPGSRLQAPAARQLPSARRDNPSSDRQTPRDDSRAETGKCPAATSDAPQIGGGAQPVLAPQAAAGPAVVADAFPAELPSSAAGVFLAIVPLVRLGWREWLTARPHLLSQQPGARLLRRIAAHHRVPPVDHVWSCLPPVEPDEASRELEQALRLWRAGLDGWLRRNARLRLADLVLRQGWLLPGVETTLVRFPLQAIEIRLRRLALDGDPGWVDWLGHSYRLVYRDRPLLGPGLA